MGTLMIDFEWPFEVTNGKWLLYLTEIVVKGTSESRCVPSGNIVNPRNLTVSERTHGYLTIPIPHWTQFFTLSFQLSDEGAKRLKRDVDTSFPYTEAAITVLTPRKVTHLLVRQNDFHTFQRFWNTPARMSKRLSSVLRSVQSKRLAVWRSPARWRTCRTTPRSKSALVCGTAPCWRWVTLRLL